jgi:integrase
MTREIVVSMSSNGLYWQADWKDPYGKRRKKSLGPKADLSHRQARKVCQQIQNDLNKRPPMASGSKMPTLGSFLNSYIASRTELKPTTRYLFQLTGEYLKKFFGEDRPIDRITRQQVRDWRSALARGDLTGGRVMAEVSVCHRCADAKAIFKRAAEDDLILFNPFDRLKVRPPKPDKNWHYVTHAELDRLLAACPSVGWKILIALCRLAGLRRGEALELPWSAIDWSRHTLTVFASKTEWHGGNKRVVPIEPKLFVLLSDAQAHGPPAQNRVCAGVSRHCLWRNFQVIRRHAGLLPWKDAFQVMRRNCETDWAQRFPQYAVSEWLGHDIAVSASHYLAVPEELYQKVSGNAQF